MIFTETQVKGAYVIDLDRRADDRGFFARAWCWNEFSARGLTARSMYLPDPNAAEPQRKGLTVTYFGGGAVFAG